MAVAIVGAGHDREHERRIRHRPRHRADMLDPLPTGDAGVALVARTGIERHPPHGRLDPHEPAEGRRNPHRAAAVAADRERPDASRHRGARARAGAAGGAFRVPRVARRLEHGVVARAAVAELRHVGLAEDDGAGRLQALDRHVVLLGQETLVGDGARDGRQVLGADEVLDADRHTRERPRVLASLDAGVHLPGGGAGIVGRGRAEGVQVRLHLFHVGDHRVRDLDCRELLSPHPRRQRDGVHAADFACSRHATPSPSD